MKKLFICIHYHCKSRSIKKKLKFFGFSKKNSKINIIDVIEDHVRLFLFQWTQ